MKILELSKFVEDIMKKYFSVNWDNTNEGAIAFALDDFKFDHELIDDLEGFFHLPFEFVLKRVK